MKNADKKTIFTFLYILLMIFIFPVWLCIEVAKNVK